jgi:hypothetical protein
MVAAQGKSSLFKHRLRKGTTFDEVPAQDSDGRFGHVKDVEFLGKHRPASEDAPQYEVKSDKTGHSALHHGDALRKR